MIQLTLQFKNASIKKRLLKVIELMNGVTVVEDSTPKSGLNKAIEGDVPNKTTLKAMKEAQKGDTIKCSSFDSYLKMVQ